MSNEETKRKLLQKDSFRNAKGLHLLHSYKSMHYLHTNICQNRVF